MAVTGHKIYIVGNIAYIDQIVDSGQAFQYEGLAKDCLPRKKYVDSTEFSFSGFNGLDETKAFPFAQLKDGNGDAWADQATFEAWATSNLGKSSAGDSALIYEGYLSQSGTDAPTIDWIGDVTGVTFGYVAVGLWTINKTGAFPFGKTFFESYPFRGNDSSLLCSLVGDTVTAEPDAIEVGCYWFKDSIRYDNECQSVYFRIIVKP